MSGEKIKALVTGGAGFLGQHIVRQLVETGKYEVSVFDIKELQGFPGVQTFVGDLRKVADVDAAVTGCEVVFHVATAAPTGSGALNKALMDGVNVEGTKNVISACQSKGVKKIVYTSSASVVFDGKTLDMVDETHPYAARPMDYYTVTKILGEKLILEANGKGGVATCALRPSGIFGEGDVLFVPTVVKQAKLGKMKYIIGSGDNHMDFTYAGNVAQAHLQAAEALTLTSPLAGSAYFVTNQDPVRFWGMMGDVCEGLGYARPSLKLPFAFIITIAFLFEYVIKPMISPFKKLETDFTVNRILLATTGRTFNNARAKKDFGYSPSVSMKDALDRTLMSFQYLKKGGAQETAPLVAKKGL